MGKFCNAIKVLFLQGSLLISKQLGKKHNSQNTTGIILAFSLGCQDLAAAAAAVLAETIKSSLPCNDPLALLKACRN